MTVRPILNSQFLKNGKNAVYSALYFMPILALLHTIVGGLICMILVSVVDDVNLNEKLLIFFRLCISIFEHHYIDDIECGPLFNEIRTKYEISIHDINY